MLTMTFLERAVYVRQTERIDFECIVRGYLAGSAWREYQNNASVCGIKLPPNLQAGAKLEAPIFTPSTKAALGAHDENVTYEQMKRALGGAMSARLRDISLAIYDFAARKMESVGITISRYKV